MANNVGSNCTNKSTSSLLYFYVYIIILSSGHRSGTTKQLHLCVGLPHLWAHWRFPREPDHSHKVWNRLWMCLSYMLIPGWERDNWGCQQCVPGYIMRTWPYNTITLVHVGTSWRTYCFNYAVRVLLHPFYRFIRFYVWDQDGTSSQVAEVQVCWWTARVFGTTELQGRQIMIFTT